MKVWLVVINSANHGLNATAHASKDAALAYVRHLYVATAPAYIADSDLLDWVGANSNDDVLVDYDEMPR